MMGKCDGFVKTKLSKLAFGLAIGITEGLYLMLLAWVAWLGGFGMSFVHHLESFFYGYAPSFVGGLYGGLWGFTDGFIFGFVVAFIYNVCLCCCKGKSSTTTMVE